MTIKRGSSRGERVGLLITFLAVLSLIGSVSDHGPTPTPLVGAQTTPKKAAWKIQWDETLAAAQREGNLLVDLSGGSFTQFRPMLAHFGEKFGISVVVGRGSDNRLLAERAAGHYGLDIGFFARTPSVTRLVPGGAVDPIAEVFFHPEVLDKSLWYGGRHSYGDLERKYVFTFAAATAFTPFEVHFNTDRIKPEEMATIGSVWEFLDPTRFKGKIVSIHPEVGGFVMELSHPDMGEKFLRKFFSPELDVFFSTDARTIVDGIARGKYALAASLSGVRRQVDAVAEEGAPVMEWASLLKKPLKERPILRSAATSHNMVLINRGPHPNAAKLFVNWWLSKEGQTAMHTMAESLADPSLREDMTRFDRIVFGKGRLPGVKYMAPDDPAFVKDLKSKSARYLQIWREVRK